MWLLDMLQHVLSSVASWVPQLMPACSGAFGYEDFFAPVLDAITTGGDYYLVANDFVPYIEAQARGQVGGSGCACQLSQY
jgi:hypothetical protein